MDNWRKRKLAVRESAPWMAGINFLTQPIAIRSVQAKKCWAMSLKSLGVSRETVVIATKVFNPMSEDPNDHGLSRKHIMESIDKSLKRLKDGLRGLVPNHRWDYDTLIEETMEALHMWSKLAKPAIWEPLPCCWKFTKAPYIPPPATVDTFCLDADHYNLIYREEEREMITLCVDKAWH